MSCQFPGDTRDLFPEGNCEHFAVSAECSGHGHLVNLSSGPCLYITLCFHYKFFSGVYPRLPFSPNETVNSPWCDYRHTEELIVVLFLC